MKQWISASLRVAGVAEEALAHHREILEAIRSKNEDSAAEAMARHLEAMGKRLLATKNRAS
jgi:DNA-binding FadR family transcriptional regulator